MLSSLHIKSRIRYVLGVDIPSAREISSNVAPEIRNNKNDKMTVTVMVCNLRDWLKIAQKDYCTVCYVTSVTN